MMSGDDPPRASDTPNGLFPRTRWTLIATLQNGNEQERDKCLEAICSAYWKPVYGWLRSRGRSPEDSKDITQEFFQRLISDNWLGAVSQEKGRLRSYLLVLLKRHDADLWNHQNALKRGGGCTLLNLDSADGEAAWLQVRVDGASPDLLYDRSWALQLIHSAMRDLQETYESSDRGPLYHALKGHIAGNDASTNLARIAAELGMNESAVKVAIHRLRTRYRERLRDAVYRTLGDMEDVDDEISWLFRVFQSP
ncbi:MAG TPA: hypothetical protein VFY13_05940 [Luteolibacter sp.]|nr:hypothetical protein [Luteolibacter sp.]